MLYVRKLREQNQKKSQQWKTWIINSVFVGSPQGQRTFWSTISTLGVMLLLSEASRRPVTGSFAPVHDIFLKQCSIINSGRNNWCWLVFGTNRTTQNLGSKVYKTEHIKMYANSIEVICNVNLFSMTSYAIQKPDRLVWNWY